MITQHFRFYYLEAGLSHHYIVNNIKMGPFFVDWKAYSLA